MTTVTAAPAAIPLTRPRAPARPSRPAAWATLARRRISLSAHTPREIFAPLATPLLFALVIAPALAKIIQATGGGGIDYSTFVIVGTVGLLIPLTCTFAGIAWFTAAVLAFTVFMYGLAEILANRIPSQEEYVGLTPVVAILPWFIAGSLFPITALPAWLAWVARALPTTHVLALLRYGVLDRTGAGLHDIWNDQHH